MTELTRLRLVGVGLAAAGLAVGVGIGAAVGTTVSPDPQAAAPVVTTTTTTTPPPAPAPVRSADPLDVGLPAVGSTAEAEGAVVAVFAPDSSGEQLLYSIGPDGIGSRIDLPADGELLALGRASVVLAGRTGVVAVPFDGGNPTLIQDTPLLGPSNGRIPGTYLWAERRGNEHLIWSLDLDTRDPEPEVANTISVPGLTAPRPIHTDTIGTVLLDDRLWSVPTGSDLGDLWSRPNMIPLAVTEDLVVAFDETKPAPSLLLDRATGDVVTADAPSDDCFVLDAMDPGFLAWACNGGFLVTTPDGSTIDGEGFPSFIDGHIIWNASPFRVDIVDPATLDIVTISAPGHDVVAVRP